MTEWKRGALTPAIQAAAKYMIGREISLKELRLIPYIQYQLFNEQTIDIQRIDADEREILQSWKKNGWVAGGASAHSLEVSKPFWDFMCEVLYLGYVGDGSD